MPPEIEGRTSPVFIPREPTQIETQEMLEIPRVGSIPRKPDYTAHDYAALMGKTPHEASLIISKIKQKHPEITGERKGLGKTKTVLSYTEPELLFFVQTYLARVHRLKKKPSSETKKRREPAPLQEDEPEQAKPEDPDDSPQYAQMDLKSEAHTFKTTEQIIGAYSVFQALLNLAQGTLDKVPRDVGKHLDKTLKTALEKKIIESNIIIKGLSNVFISTSKEHLERFFKVNFLAALELWELKPEEAETKEDKDLVQIFKDLKGQKYTKEQVTKEVLADHFGLEIEDKSTPVVT